MMVKEPAGDPSSDPQAVLGSELIVSVALAQNLNRKLSLERV